MSDGGCNWVFPVPTILVFFVPMHIFKILFNTYPVNHILFGVIFYVLTRIFFPSNLAAIIILMLAAFREIGQSLHWWPHEDQPWQIAVNDVSHFGFGILIGEYCIRIFQFLF